MKLKEIWKDIPGFEGLYQASNLGEIRSLNYKRTGKVKVLSPGISGKGYYRVELCKDGKKKNFSVHRLTYEAFHGTIPPGMTVDHINGIKTDNRLENLQLLTRGDNTRKANKGKKRKPFTEEHKAKISLARKGKPLTEEHKAKLSASHKARSQKKLIQEIISY